MAEFERIELAPDYLISRIISGCWQIAPDHGGGPGSHQDCLRIFAELVECGFTTFDCADIYAGTEELLGRFRRTLSDPDTIQIHTKYVPDRASLHEVTNADVDAAINRSLRRLGVERLDLLQFHWWSYSVQGAERVTDRLLHAQRAGKVRLIGVTNFDTPHIRQMVDSGVPIVSLQAQYSLLDRRPEKLMADYARASGVRLLGYGTLAGGFLSNRYVKAEPPLTMNRSLQKYRLIIEELGGWSALQRMLGVLNEIADKHDTTIDAVAARWVLDQPAVAAIILGTGSTSRAQKNVGIGALTIDDEDRQKISNHLAYQPIPRGDMYDLERDPQGSHAKIIKTDLRDIDART